MVCGIGWPLGSVARFSTVLSLPPPPPLPLSPPQAAKARACGNLGNAYSALNNFSEATKYYMQSLVVAKESNNLAGQGQAYYCLGSTYVMMKNYVKAIEYHEQHLAVAEQLGDKQGQSES